MTFAHFRVIAYERSPGDENFVLLKIENRSYVYD